jgi:hypothetical protein
MLRAAAILFLGTALTGCVTVERDEENQPPPDRVVGIELKCDLVLLEETVQVTSFEGWDVCADWTVDQPTRGYQYNVRKELTIRSGSRTYVVTYGPEHEVWLGMEWPPK